jgi:hypothetical protein
MMGRPGDTTRASEREGSGADLVEQYTNDAGEAAMRLTARGQQVANQAAMTSEDDAALLEDSPDT